MGQRSSGTIFKETLQIIQNFRRSKIYFTSFTFTLIFSKTSAWLFQDKVTVRCFFYCFFFNVKRKNWKNIGNKYATGRFIPDLRHSGAPLNPLLSACFSDSEASSCTCNLDVGILQAFRSQKVGSKYFNFVVNAAKLTANKFPYKNASGTTPVGVYVTVGTSLSYRIAVEAFFIKSHWFTWVNMSDCKPVIKKENQWKKYTCHMQAQIWAICRSNLKRIWI